MTTLQLILLAALAVSLLSAGISALCLSSLSKTRAEAHNLQIVVAQVERELAAAIKMFDEQTERASIQARRIAWLESRLRNSSNAAEQEPVVTEDPKSTMSDRRRRVMKLRERGQDSRTIAATLNMPHGEVELIIGLTS